jgi:diadenosine tetraphosphate (Ap4A) HIT family hydrolase
MTEMTCRFCLLPDRDRVVLETDNFAVVMSLGAIVEGYALVVSRTHFSCSAEIPAEQQDEFRSLVDLVEDAQRELYGVSSLYEHGRSGACLAEGQGEDHCYHAHLHAVPIPSIRDRVAAAYPLENFKSFLAVHERYEENGEPYLLVGDEQGIGVAWDPQNLPRHYLRSVAATSMGEEHLGDWVAFPQPRVIRDGVARFAPVLRDKAAHRFSMR